MQELNVEQPAELEFTGSGAVLGFIAYLVVIFIIVLI